ncbi:MAG: hypothetical protein ACK4YP_16755 [Myxococcota bacterium]
MMRWIGLVTVLACGCVDYQFAAVKEADGLRGDTGGLPDTDDRAAADSGGSQTGTTPDPGSGAVPDTGDPGDVEDTCAIAENLTGHLDRYQTPGDGRVLYCHGTGSGRFVLVESDISSCFPHLDHRHDVFPSTGCDS